jgi:polysaccharide biosynthesis/export protein
VLQQTKKIIIAGVSAMALLGTQAQAVTPSPQMIEQFKQLPKSEQQRLARQYGLDPGMLGGSMTQPQITNPQVVGGRDTANSVIDQSAAAKKEINFSADASKQELRRFGYDLFAGEPSTFAPVSDVPVPSEYLVGPGDNIKVQLYGKENKEYDLTINREGVIQFPELGPISVMGLTFAELRDAVSQRIAQQMIGIESNISMGELRSIRIFVAGDAYKPGSYTVSSLSTMTQALFVAGGVNEIGSLRNVQLKRNGKLVGSLDLYDLLLRGDASGDKPLQAGDVVFIPAVGGLVSVTGEVRRPAVYEIKPNETMGDIIAMAAGLKPGAYPKSSSIERYNDRALKSIVNVDFTSATGQNTLARAGDFIRVKSASEQYESAVTLVGAVVRPGKYQWFEGQKISDLLPSIWGDLAVSADLDYGLLIREIDQYGAVEVHQFAPGRAIAAKDAAEDLLLQARDRLIIFNFDDDVQNRYELNQLVKQRVEKVTSLSGNTLLGNDLFKAGFTQLGSGQLSQRAQIAGVVVTDKPKTEEETLVKGVVNKMLANLFDDADLIKLSVQLNREELLYPVIVMLNNQGRSGEGVKIVAINGQVKHPGVYPLTVNARITDLVSAAGGLKEGAYTGNAELSTTTTDAESSSVWHKSINLEQAMGGDVSANSLLQGRDVLTVLTTPDWQESKLVEIRGEVKFPGMYNIRRGEALSDVLERAGGFTEYAYLPSAVFVRESVANQLRRDIATRGVSKDGEVLNYSDAQLMLTDLENIKAVGRLVVDLPAIYLGIKEADIQLEDADILYVPSTKQTISVMGEVQHPATHRFKEGLTLDQYLAMSGGASKRADEGRIYVIQANGAVLIPGRSNWFSAEEQLQPGDTIVIPLDTEYKDNLTLWTQVTGIIFNSAVALASIAAL